MKRLAIITTHPIQYNAPLFALLASRGKLQIKVFYTWGKSVLEKKYDPGFGKNIDWDIPLLDGYEYCFVENIAIAPGSHHYKGINNPTLLKEVQEWGANAVLVYGWAFKSHLAVIRFFYKKIPVFFRGDSTLLRKQPGIKTVLRKLFLKWVYQHVDYAFYVGSENKLYYKAFGLKQNQLIYAPHAVDNNRFADTNGKHDILAKVWREKLGIEPHELTILYAGKLELIKEPEFIVKLSKKLTDLSIRFVIVGNGSLESTLKNLAEGDKKILFIDFQNQLNMPVVYRLGDIFMLPSKSETWGLSINEAMACGRGLLVRDTCGCANDLVTNGINGYIFNTVNMDGLFEIIVSLIQQKVDVKKMGNESLKKIKDFSFEHIAYAIEVSVEKTVC